MNMNEAKMLTPSERLQAMEVLWDTICHDETPLDPPVWHKKFLPNEKKNLNQAMANL